MVRRFLITLNVTSMVCITIKIIILYLQWMNIKTNDVRKNGNNLFRKHIYATVIYCFVTFNAMLMLMRRGKV